MNWLNSRRRFINTISAVPLVFGSSPAWAAESLGSLLNKKFSPLDAIRNRRSIEQTPEFGLRAATPVLLSNPCYQERKADGGDPERMKVVWPKSRKSSKVELT